MHRRSQDTLPATLDLQAIPLGLDQNRPVPRENPLTKAKVQLGRRLFSIRSCRPTVRLPAQLAIRPRTGSPAANAFRRAPAASGSGETRRRC